MKRNIGRIGGGGEEGLYFLNLYLTRQVS
jgi:hypothetical protein